MTYIIPHFRYGALIYHNIKEGTNIHKNKQDRIAEDVQRKLNRTIKQMYDLPMSTPNETMKKTMGNWNMKTITLMSYARSANIWLKEKENIKEKNNE